MVGYPEERGPVDGSIAADLASLVADKPHVWLVLTRTFHGDHDGTLARLLSELMIEDATRNLPGITVRRYKARAPHP